LINFDYQFYDSYVSWSVDVAGDEVQHLTAIAEGTSENDRVGEQIRLLSCEGKLQIHMANSEVTLDDRSFVRMVLVLDKQANNTAVTNMSDVIENDAGTTSPYDPINYSNRKRFKILKDFYFSMDNAKNHSKAIQFKYRFKSPPQITYKASAAAVPNKNALYLMAVSSNTTNPPSVVGTVRVAFSP
jgi:hypothetical protein